MIVGCWGMRKENGYRCAAMAYHVHYMAAIAPLQRDLSELEVTAER
jgi:hypothetical protein